MSEKETFFPNDRPILVFEARRPNVDRFDDPDGIPAQPSDVYIRVFNGTSGEMVVIGGSEEVRLGLQGSLLYMENMVEVEDRGALIYVTIPEEVTSVTGNYTLYVTTEYMDGSSLLRITIDQKIQVSEYR